MRHLKKIILVLIYVYFTQICYAYFTFAAIIVSQAFEKNVSQVITKIKKEFANAKKLYFVYEDDKGHLNGSTSKLITVTFF